MSTLPRRRETILKIILGEYIASATPVASESIARSYGLGISPATIRHEMAHLEEEGYIIRPHISAGGIPSDKGYRYYVECLIREARLSEEEQYAIYQPFDQAERELEGLARLAALVLSQRVRSIAFATLPCAPECHFRYLDLAALQEFLILLVLLLQEGQLKRQLLTLEQAFSQDELTAVANRLNIGYKGLTYSQIGFCHLELSPIGGQVTEVIMQMMEAEDKQQYEHFYLDGLRHLVSQPEFARSKKMISLVEALEEREVLNKLLCSFGGEPGLRVAIGSENEEEVLQECSVILSDYQVPTGARGAIGVIGPTRMPYNQVIPTVDYLSAVMSEQLSELYV